MRANAHPPHPRAQGLYNQRQLKRQIVCPVEEKAEHAMRFDFDSGILKSEESWARLCDLSAAKEAPATKRRRVEIAEVWRVRAGHRFGTFAVRYQPRPCRVDDTQALTTFPPTLVGGQSLGHQHRGERRCRPARPSLQYRVAQAL